uniref:Uncharacterized protein n=1 Tax=Glossina austeni TaxID=7395 RepID=A0A1A9VC44_GLOAU
MYMYMCIWLCACVFVCNFVASRVKRCHLHNNALAEKINRGVISSKNIKIRKQWIEKVEGLKFPYLVNYMRETLSAFLLLHRNLISERELCTQAACKVSQVHKDNQRRKD